MISVLALYMCFSVCEGKVKITNGERYVDVRAIK